jgi:hypothetical protein
MTKPEYLVIDMISGALDGLYASQESADQARANLAKRHKSGAWITTLITTNPGKHQVPDCSFHHIKLGKKK